LKQLSGDERLVFVSAQKKIPFAVSSVLPYQKTTHTVGKIQHRLVFFPGNVQFWSNNNG